MNSVTDTTKDPRITAARLLRENATSMAESISTGTGDPDWSNEPEALTYYREHIAVADALDLSVSIRAGQIAGDKPADNDLHKLIRAFGYTTNSQTWELVEAINAAAQPSPAAVGPVAWRFRYRSEPGMLGHYPWTYIEQEPRRLNDASHEVEPIYTAPPAPQPLPQDRRPLTAHFTPFYLLANCRKLCARKYNSMPNWVIASSLFAVGSTTAARLCREAGVDPDAFKVRKVGITAQQGDE